MEILNNGGIDMMLLGEKDILSKRVNYNKLNEIKFIYFLLRDEEVVYIGQTNNLRNRLSNHKKDGKVFDDYTVINVHEEEINELEDRYIGMYKPVYNSRYKGKSFVTVDELVKRYDISKEELLPLLEKVKVWNNKYEIQMSRNFIGRYKRHIKENSDEYKNYLKRWEENQIKLVYKHI